MLEIEGADKYETSRYRTDAPMQAKGCLKA